MGFEAIFFKKKRSVDWPDLTEEDFEPVDKNLLFLQLQRHFPDIKLNGDSEFILIKKNYGIEFSPGREELVHLLSVNIHGDADLMALVNAIECATRMDAFTMEGERIDNNYVDNYLSWYKRVIQSSNKNEI